MIDTTQHHDRIVAVILAVTMVLSVGVAPVAAGVDGDSTARAGPTTTATSISSCTTINSPGQYVLANDITSSGATNCIRIAASDVVLDGNGHVIEGVGDPGTRGVYVYEAPSAGQGITLTNVTVTNLGVTEWAEGIRFDRVENGVVEGVDAWHNEKGVRFDVLSRDHAVYGSGIAENRVGLVLDGGGGADVRGNEFEANDWGIRAYSDGNGIVENELFDNEYGIEVAYATGTEILGNHFEDHRSISVLLQAGATKTVVAENEIFGTPDALAGIWVDSGDNDVIENELVETGENGIAVATGQHNLVGGNRIESVENGLAVYSATENEFEQNTVRGTDRAILLEDGARNNVFRDDDVAGNQWAFYAAYDASSEARGLFIGNSTTPTTLSFQAHDVAIRAISSPPAPPSNLGSLGKFVGTNATSSRARLALSVHYSDQEVQQAGLNESQLRVWRHAGSWSKLVGSSVDTTDNVVSASVNSFGVLAPLATPADNVTRVAFKYGEYGGNLNIEINGDFVNFGRFWQLDGATVGGTSISVTNTTVSGGEQGVVEIAGSVDSFRVGGQEFWMDDVEFGPASQPRATVDFTTLTPTQSQYVVNETFQSSPDNVSITVEEFVWGGGTVYYGGEAIPSNNSPPMSGGSGQDMYPNNANLRFDIDGIVNGTSAP